MLGVLCSIRNNGRYQYPMEVLQAAEIEKRLGREKVAVRTMEHMLTPSAQKRCVPCPECLLATGTSDAFVYFARA